MRDSFELRVTVCAASPLSALRALDRPGIAVCDVVRAWEELPDRAALLAPHAVLLADRPPSLRYLLSALRRAAPLRPPRVATGFLTDTPVDGADGDLHRALLLACRPACGVLAGPTLLIREERARGLLNGLGMERGLAGYGALARGAALLSAWPLPAPPLQSWLYPLLAREAGVTAAAVEKRVRGAIESAWLHGDLAAQSALLGLSVSADRGKPTNSELLFRLAERVGEEPFLAPAAEICYTIPGIKSN